MSKRENATPAAFRRITREVTKEFVFMIEKGEPDAGLRVRAGGVQFVSEPPGG
jgi:hypothetical protein